mmetsp:Transcript_46167/g.72239  ORF Transcript_46167/g.72239 Transcript_46167/m.72239 type:complete len:120 (+) Transcript_46167:248-607(+)
MEKTTFASLRLRLGRTYLFTHSGGCEHIMTFKTMEMQRVADLGRYPLLVFKSRPNIRPCSICEKNKADWVTYDDLMSKSSPGFFCQLCFNQAHYCQETGRLLATPQNSFKCYRYHHDAR